MLDTLLIKMREYLQMETEISFAEFKGYFEQLMASLQNDYDGMSHEELFTAKFILDIVSANSKARAGRKGPEAKKFKKMAEKSSFWAEAIYYRLQKEGLSRQDIDTAVGKLGQEEANQEQKDQDQEQKDEAVQAGRSS